MTEPVNVLADVPTGEVVSEQHEVEQKKYQKIVRHGKRGTHLTVQEGAQIVIQEKIDGANASFRLNPLTKEIEVFSRNQHLTGGKNGTLNGFYGWVMENIKPSDLVPFVIYFGEWTTPHKVKYDVWNVKQFFLYDLYDMLNEEYSELDEVRSEAKELGLRLAPILYEGTYVSYEHLESFVGRSHLGEHGEGIVVKNYDYRPQMFTKLVSKEFIEMQAQSSKQKSPSDPTKMSPEREFVGKFLVTARVEKMLHKMVDEEILDEEYGIEDMGKILKHLGNAIRDDIIEEEGDELPKDFDMKDIQKSIGKVLPVKVKEVMASLNKI